MRLVIVDNEGVATTVLDDIESFNLDKALARTEVVTNIQNTLDVIVSNSCTDSYVDELDDRSDDDPTEFSESPAGYEARYRWAERYEYLNGAPEGPWDY